MTSEEFGLMERHIVELERVTPKSKEMLNKCQPVNQKVKMKERN